MTEVVTALSHQWESSVAATLAQVNGVSVVRRCADVSELVSVVEAGVGELAVVSGDLRGLDLSVVRRLRAHGVRVVGLHPADDDVAEQRLHQLSISQVLPAEASATEFALALVLGRERRDPDPATTTTSETTAPGGDDDGFSAVGDLDDAEPVPARGGADRANGTGASATGGPDPRPGDGEPRRARLLAVWGPTGAPGRTTVATSLAAELAGRGVDVLLVDADTYGGCVAQSLGLLDEAPGIAAACRAADQGTLDVSGLARLAPVVAGRLRVLTGMPKAERWTEVRAAPLERVLELARSLVEVVVVDCGFCLEDDEELSYDTSAPRRNEATLTSLACADEVVAVGGADPVALQRLVRGLQELGTVPSPEPVVVVNRVRSAAVGAHPATRIADSLRRFAGLETVRFVPDEPAVLDACLLAGRSVVEQAPGSGVRSAVADLADALVPAGAGRQVAGRSFWARVTRQKRTGPELRA
ncbi:MAG: hypothetical protein ABIS35_04025 [Terracoccus sp.]